MGLAILAFFLIILQLLTACVIYMLLRSQLQTFFAKVKRSERSHRQVTIEHLAEFELERAAVRSEIELLTELTDAMAKRADDALNMANVMAKKFDAGYKPAPTAALSLAAFRKGAEDRVAAELVQRQTTKPIVRGHEDDQEAAA